MGFSNFPFGFNGGLTVRNVPIAPTHPRKVYWVGNNSSLLVGEKGASNNNKGGFLDPFSTLDYAVGVCAYGDWIYVRPGYTQSMTAADAVDVDVAGVTIVGLGRGTKRPKFTFDNSAGEFVIGADDVRIENLWFVPSVTGITHAVDVETGADGFQIINCEFSGKESAGDEFLTAITIAASCTEGLIQGCYFDAGEEGAAGAITAVTPVGLKIWDNYIVGDYSTGCINTTTAAAVRLSVMRNVIINGVASGLNAVAAITMSSAGELQLGDNLIGSDVATFALMITNYTAGVNLGNRYTDDAGGATTAVDRSASVVVSADG